MKPSCYLSHLAELFLLVAQICVLESRRVLHNVYLIVIGVKLRSILDEFCVINIRWGVHSPQSSFVCLWHSLVHFSHWIRTHHSEQSSRLLKRVSLENLRSYIGNFHLTSLRSHQTQVRISPKWADSFPLWTREGFSYKMSRTHGCHSCEHPQASRADMNRPLIYPIIVMTTPQPIGIRVGGGGGGGESGGNPPPRPVDGQQRHQTRGNS